MSGSTLAGTQWILIPDPYQTPRRFWIMVRTGQPSMSESSLTVFVVAIVAVPLLGLAVPGSPPQVAHSCVVRELARKELTSENGTKIFVEPAAFASDRKGRILLAGPADLATVDSGDRTTRLVHNTIFGVVLDSRLNHHPIPNPVTGGEFIGVRAVAKDSSGWHIVFGHRATAQQPPEGVGMWAASAADVLWYGVFTGRTWTRLEQLPIPSEAVVYQLHASQLVASGDSLAFAVPVRTARDDRHTLLYERRNGVWTQEIIPTRTTVVEVAYSGSFGLVLAVVQADTTLQQDGGSLIIRHRTEGWRPIQRLVHGGSEGAVVSPSILFVGDTAIVSWYGSPPRPRGARTLQAHALLGVLNGTSARKIVLDSAVLGEPRALIPAMHNRSTRIWVTRHRSRGNAGTELRFVQDSAAGVHVLGSLPDPFAGYLSTVAVDRTRLVVSGLKYVPGKYLTTLLLQFDVACTGQK